MKPKLTPGRTLTLRAEGDRPEAKTSRKKTKLSRAKPSREKVRAYRKRMRAKGLRLVQMWLPDTRTADFAAQAHADSLAIARSQTEQDDQAFIDSISWWNSEEAAVLARSEPAHWRKEPSD
jgi:hypothetical protein